MRKYMPYVSVVVLCILVQIWLLQLWRADLWVPFSYFGDGLLSSGWIKGLIDNGWYLQNSYLGAPIGQTLYDFPLSNNLDFIIIKIIGLFVPNYAFAMNFFFLLTFPLTALTSMLVLRQMGISNAVAALGSLLYAFLPYHFWRGEGHLFLAAYYVIPLVVLVSWWIFQNKISLRPINRNLILSIIVCILIGSTYIYYPIFSLFFVVVAGIISASRHKNTAPIVISVLLAALILLTVIINVSPTLIYQHDNGKNPQVAERFPSDSEYYGLKIIQLLLPIDIHRLQFMASATDRYFKSAPLCNHSAIALGIVISAGFLILIACLFYRGLFDERLLSLSQLNIAALLLACVGGLGTIMSYLISPEIRCYDRICVFIAFFSMAALMVVLDLMREKYKSKRLLFNAFLVLLLAGGILDQTGSFYPYPSVSTDYERIKQEYINDDAFIGKIEAAMPPGVTILQLPYLSYPEGGNVNGMTDCSPMKAYLHSKNLHWSYGAMKGRPGADWIENITALPLPVLVEMAPQNGFSGLYIDRAGYVDNGANITQELKGLLGTEPIEDSGGRYVFFGLSSHPDSSEYLGAI